ncbi:MAG: serine--tRNA ligase [Nanoarchaeota archaeon]|nr:serine--tRNA ligase [Nanoarchaeota archaeon]MBU1321304.1 serine--tRNA ligase [Nanoarchaeota archaeon]MBU1597295.1 serine--tRNA ligase [Nanoarchaeota archaeon]MBU2441590.1 serine--tRNA ligase [Nanoarchaeota archaeon]
MLDIKFIRENPALCKDNMKKKFQDPKVVDDFLKTDEQWRKLRAEIDTLRHDRNKISEEINKAKKAGKDVKAIVKKAKDIPNIIKKNEEKQAKLQKQLLPLLAKIPNIMHESVPIGKDDTQNPEIKKWGKPPKFSFPIKNHVEICESLGIADFEASAKSSGNGFYYLEGDLALLNQALIRFAVDFMQKKGYYYIETPIMLKNEILAASLDTEEFAKTIYEVKDEGLALIGTAEYSLLARYTGATFLEKDLPKKVFSYSMCFRKEIGSHGINEKGLWRTHQFNKVEQVIFCAPEDSYKMYDELLKNSEEIMQTLDLPYRVIEICSGDLAAWKTKSADVEVWRPTTKEYGEVMSLSNCTDYQVRNLNIRVDRQGKRELVHALNNTALATSRIMVAILENFQNKDGTVTVPKALVPYMPGKIKIIGKKK